MHGRTFSFVALFLMSFLFVSYSMAGEKILRNNLNRAQPGDYIVAAQNKTYTLMHIRAKEGPRLIVEEVSVPSNRVPSYNFSWRNWFEKGANGHTCWILYVLDTQSGQILECYSFSKNGWYTMPHPDNFLSTLLNLQFERVPPEQRKRVGPPPSGRMPDMRPLWQPRMIVDGYFIEGVRFSAWKTQWPKDGGDLSGRTIEVFLPEESEAYPSYFPYWLQVSGLAGRAKVRIIDSGTDLKSPKPGLSSNPR